MKNFKKQFIMMVIALLMIAAPVLAEGGSECKSITTSGVVQAATCRVTAVYVARDTGGTNPVTVELYDNASGASGDYILPPIQVDGSSTDPIDGLIAPDVIAHNGVYAKITTSGSTVVTVCYKRR